MEVALEKIFTYRCCPGLACFGVSAQYVYAMTDTAIVQINRRSAVRYTHPLSSRALSTLVSGDLLYLALRSEVLFFDGALHTLGPVPLLSISFKVGQRLCTLSETCLIVFSAEEKRITHRLALERLLPSAVRKYGCSACAVAGQAVYLAFEGGRVLRISDFVGWIGDETQDQIPHQEDADTSHQSEPAIHGASLLALPDFKETPLSVAVCGRHIFMALVSAKIARAADGEDAFIFCETAEPVKKIILCGQAVVAISGSSVLFYDHELRLLGRFFGKFPITDICLHGDTLHVSYSSSLIEEYAVPKFCGLEAPGSE
ncbi:hypothetical protein PAPHI01_0945 [Pancytospora philotis]|nr:hypothetical protein PAPHI01_0945 [Pancytospora philotis]